MRAVSAGGLGRLVGWLVPGGGGLATLLAVAALAAVLANLPRLGPATRFVVDHAPCAVLLAWPAQAPDLASIPPPPAHPPPPPGTA